jgi:drug/metabolite transporter (DMT)-like permease
LTFYRLWLGAGFLSVLVYASGRRLTWATMRGSWLGGILLAGDMAMFFSAVKLTSIVDVTVIGALQPALVFLVARRLFSERLGRWDAFWIVLAMTGVTVTVIGSSVSTHHHVAGDLMAVGSLLCWAAYWLVAKRARAKLDTLEYTAGVMIVAALTLVPVVWLSGQSLGRVNAGDWLWIFLLTTVPGGAHLAMNWAHRYVDASISSAISCLNPLVAAVAAMAILGQPLTIVQVLGALAGLLAVAVIAARHRQPAASQLE